MTRELILQEFRPAGIADRPLFNKDYDVSTAIVKETSCQGRIDPPKLENLTKETSPTLAQADGSPYDRAKILDPDRSN